jgi:hypothetical protein
MRNPLFCLLAVLITFTATCATAGGVAWGPQVGLSSGPSQVVFGLHLVVPVARSFDFAPSIDAGVGNDLATFAFNGDVHFNVAPDNSLRPYVGLGITGYSVNPLVSGDEGTLETGASLLGGIWFNHQSSVSYFLEARAGLGNVPDFKALIGLNF